MIVCRKHHVARSNRRWGKGEGNEEWVRRRIVKKSGILHWVVMRVSVVDSPVRCLPFGLRGAGMGRGVDKTAFDSNREAMWAERIGNRSRLCIEKPMP